MKNGYFWKLKSHKGPKTSHIIWMAYETKMAANTRHRIFLQKCLWNRMEFFLPFEKWAFVPYRWWKWHQHGKCIHVAGNFGNQAFPEKFRPLTPGPTPKEVMAILKKQYLNCLVISGNALAIEAIQFSPIGDMNGSQKVKPPVRAGHVKT